MKTTGKEDMMERRDQDCWTGEYKIGSRDHKEENQEMKERIWRIMKEK